MSDGEIIGIVSPDGRVANVQGGALGLTIQVIRDDTPGTTIPGEAVVFGGSGSAFPTFGQRYDGTPYAVAVSRSSAGYLTSAAYIGVSIGTILPGHHGVCAGPASICGVWSVGSGSQSINPGQVGALVVSSATVGRVDYVDQAGLTGDGIVDYLGLMIKNPPGIANPEIVGVLVLPARSPYQNT